jgi:hypothetical protein
MSRARCSSGALQASGTADEAFGGELHELGLDAGRLELGKDVADEQRGAASCARCR